MNQPVKWKLTAQFVETTITISGRPERFAFEHDGHGNDPIVVAAMNQGVSPNDMADALYRAKRQR